MDFIRPIRLVHLPSDAAADVVLRRDLILRVEHGLLRRLGLIQILWLLGCPDQVNDPPLTAAAPNRHRLLLVKFPEGCALRHWICLLSDLLLDRGTIVDAVDLHHGGSLVIALVELYAGRHWHLEYARMLLGCAEIQILGDQLIAEDRLALGKDILLDALQLARALVLVVLRVRRLIFGRLPRPTGLLHLREHVLVLPDHFLHARLGHQELSLHRRQM